MVAVELMRAEEALSSTLEFDSKVLRSVREQANANTKGIKHPSL